MVAGVQLFRSKDLLVRYRQAREDRRSEACFVTFDSYTYNHKLERQGFGEDFLRDEGLDAVHVLTRDNRWYQYAELDEALAAVAGEVHAYPRLFTYGSSMGGYAALRFAHRLGARAAIAISPQFSLDRRVVPFEQRWQADAAKIRFREAAFVAPPRQVIFYDPRFTPDAAHAGLFAAAGSAELVGIPYAGHPAGQILAETGLLQEAIRGIVAEGFDPLAIQRSVRERRRGSQHYFFMLARYARNRPLATRIALLRRAAAIVPESHILSELAAMLDQAGAHEEAGPLHRQAIRLVPSNAHARINHALHLEALGSMQAAAAVLHEAIARHVGSVRLLMRLLQLRMALRRWQFSRLDALIGRLAEARETSPCGARVSRWLKHRLR
jgi:tetratricopeptide (TPR) repeat protein